MSSPPDAGAGHHRSDSVEALDARLERDERTFESRGCADLLASVRLVRARLRDATWLAAHRGASLALHRGAVVGMSVRSLTTAFNEGVAVAGTRLLYTVTIPGGA